MLDTKAIEHLRAIDDCAATCLQCATCCLSEDDPTLMHRCITLDLQCADVCRRTAASLARGDSKVRSALLLCADACRICAQECGKHSMSHCQECAASCYACANSCCDLLR